MTKKWETVGPSSPKNTEKKKYRDLRLSAPGMPYFHTEKASKTWLLKHWLAITPINMDINPLWRLGHTVLIFQDVSHFWVQSWMPVPNTVVNPVVHWG